MAHWKKRRREEKGRSASGVVRTATAGLRRLSDGKRCRDIGTNLEVVLRQPSDEGEERFEVVLCLEEEERKRERARESALRFFPDERGSRRDSLLLLGSGSTP